MNPRVSILLPTFNRARLIGRSIRSVLAQTDPRFELLVIDDGSTDETETVVGGFGDPRIRYLRTESNGGAPAARNFGIRQAKTDLIAFQDSDDEWMPDKLQKQLDAMDETGGEVGVVYSDMLRILADGETVYHCSPDIRRGVWVDPEIDFYQTYCLGIQTTLARKDLLLEAGGLDERLGFYDDLELYLRVAQLCEFRRIREPLVRYYDTGGLVSSWRQELADRKTILGRHDDLLREREGRFRRRERLRLAARTMFGPLLRSWTQTQNNLRPADWKPESESTR